MSSPDCVLTLQGMKWPHAHHEQSQRPVPLADPNVESLTAIVCDRRSQQSLHMESIVIPKILHSADVKLLTSNGLDPHSRRYCIKQEFCLADDGRRVKAPDQG